jgi:hypothetical protein
VRSRRSGCASWRSTSPSSSASANATTLATTGSGWFCSATAKPGESSRPWSRIWPPRRESNSSGSWVVPGRATKSPTHYGCYPPGSSAPWFITKGWGQILEGEVEAIDDWQPRNTKAIMDRARPAVSILAVIHRIAAMIEHRQAEAQRLVAQVVKSLATEFRFDGPPVVGETVLLPEDETAAVVEARATGRRSGLHSRSPPCWPLAAALPGYVGYLTPAKGLLLLSCCPAAACRYPRGGGGAAHGAKCVGIRPLRLPRVIMWTPPRRPSPLTVDGVDATLGVQWQRIQPS